MSTYRTQILALALTVASLTGFSQTAFYQASLTVEATCLLVGKTPSSTNEVTKLNGGIASHASLWKLDSVTPLLPARGGREEVRKWR